MASPTQTMAINETTFTFFQQSFEGIRTILKDIEIPIVKGSVQEKIYLKEEYKTKLNKSFALVVHELASQPKDKSSLFLLSEILTKFGRLRYEEDFSKCMVLMRASLNLQLVACNIFDILSFDVKGLDSLTALEDLLCVHDNFSAFDDFILKSDVGSLVSLITERNLSSENLTLMGFTISWLANSLHHTAGYRTKEENKIIEKINHQRFDQLYAIGEKILIEGNTEKAKLELAELYYNGFCGVELRKDPNNIAGAHAWLDKAKIMNPSLEMTARVANLKSCGYSNIGNLDEANKFLLEAIKIRQSFPKENQDPFLIANLHNRHAGFLLRQGNLEEADRVSDLAIEYSKECRGQRHSETDKLIDQTNDHQYFGYYDLQKAQIKLAKNQIQEALGYTNRAFETFNYHKQDSLDLIEMASKLATIISEKLK